MLRYLSKRLFYLLPILLGVNLITFLLFFVVNTPDDMARIQLGHKYVSQTAIDSWKQSKGYHLPLFFNRDQQGLKQFSETIFYQKSVPLFYFDFGRSDAGRDIGFDIKERMGASLAIAVPSLILALIANIIIAMWLVLYRGRFLESLGLVVSVLLMSVSALFFIIMGQLLFSVVLHYFPISGFQSGWHSWRFILLPVLISVIAGLGAGVRWYRSIFLEEINKDYIKAAYAKGLSDNHVLFKHLLKNGMIPILTGIVVILPTLFMGSFVLESFFAIPGLGSYTIDAIYSQDFAIVRAMVFLGSVLYVIGLILTDVCYTIVDPRVRL